jgi:hypothetical protein
MKKIEERLMAIKNRPTAKTRLELNAEPESHCDGD